MADDLESMFVDPVPHQVEDIQDPVIEKTLYEKIADILIEYNNEQSSIPLNHEYWKLINEQRMKK